MIAMEEWMSIIGFEGLYEISDLGRIKSLARIVDYGHQTAFRKERIMSLAVDGDGYNVVGLYKNGEGKNYRVNRLVAIHYIPNPNNLPIVNHKFGNKLDNRSFMLEWCTNSANIQHAYNFGLIKAAMGSKCGASKLTESQVLQMRELAANGTMHKDIAAMFKHVSQKYSQYY